VLWAVTPQQRQLVGAFSASLGAVVASVLIDELWRAVVAGIEERELEFDEARRASLHAHC
jgi:hypothetical protein